MARVAESLQSAAARLPPALAGWFAAQGWVPHPHQLELLAATDDTLLIAPTGGGKKPTRSAAKAKPPDLNLSRRRPP